MAQQLSLSRFLESQHCIDADAVAVARAWSGQAVAEEIRREFCSINGTGEACVTGTSNSYVEAIAIGGTRYSCNNILNVE